MYIIIVGGGKVGFYLAKELIDEGHEALIIERDQHDTHRSERIAEELGREAVLHGDGCEAATLDGAGASRADMFIAVTGEDEDNLIACQVAKHRFKVPRTIARINNPKNEAIFKRLGIDTTVSATQVILAHIEQELPTHPLIPLLTLRGGGLEMVEVKIPDHCPTVGKSLREIELPESSMVSLVVDMAGEAHVPTDDTILQAEDEVVAITPPAMEDALRAALTGLHSSVRGPR
ncbi:MAG: potassium channel family protein [Dehalococcoidia bacterium]